MTDHHGGVTSMPLRDFIDENELPTVVEICSGEEVIQHVGDESYTLNKGDTIQLVRTLEEVEIVLDPEYVVTSQAADDTITVPLDYAGTFNCVPFYGEDFTFETVSDLLNVSPRYVKTGIAFDIPGVARVEEGDILEVLSKVQCADDNIYLQCHHQSENKEILLPLEFEGHFREVTDHGEYTAGELYHKLPKRVKFSVETLSKRHEGGLSIKGLAADTAEDMVLQKLTRVEVKPLEATGGYFRIPVLFPINVTSCDRYTDEDFTQTINIHDVIKLGEQLPLVAKVMDHAPVIPGVRFDTGTLVQIHNLNFTRKVVAVDTKGRHYLIPEGYNGKFRLPQRRFATAQELWDAGIRSRVCVRKSYISLVENFDSVYEGDVLKISTKSEDGALVCSKQMHPGHKIIRLPLTAIGNFDVLESNIVKLSQIKRERLPVGAYVEELPASPKHAKVLKVGSKVTILHKVQSCAVLVSAYESADEGDVYEVLEHFPFNIKPLHSIPPRAKSSGIHHMQRIEKLTTQQLDVILSAVGGDLVRNMHEFTEQGADSNEVYAEDKHPEYLVLDEQPEIPPKKGHVNADQDARSKCVTNTQNPRRPCVTNTQNNNDDATTKPSYAVEETDQGPMYFTLEKPKSDDRVHRDEGTVATTEPPYAVEETEEPMYFALEKPTSDDTLHHDEGIVRERATKKLGRRRLRLSLPVDEYEDEPAGENTQTTQSDDRVYAVTPEEDCKQAQTRGIAHTVVNSPTDQKQKTVIPPIDDNISEFTMRDVGLLLRYLHIREEVITKFYNDRVDGISCCYLTKTDLHTRYQMKAKEVALLETYINKSKRYTEGRNIYHFS